MERESGPEPPVVRHWHYSRVPLGFRVWSEGCVDWHIDCTCLRQKNNNSVTTVIKAPSYPYVNPSEGSIFWIQDDSGMVYTPLSGPSSAALLYTVSQYGLCLCNIVVLPKAKISGRPEDPGKWGGGGGQGHRSCRSSPGTSETWASGS